MLVLTAFAISTNAIPPLTTTISAELGVPYEQFGYLFMVQFILFSIASFIGGWLSARFHFSLRTLILLGFFIVTVCLFTGSLLTSFAIFIFWIIPYGFSGGLLEPFSTILAARFDQPGSSKIVNLTQVFFCVGAVIAPQIVSMMLKRGVPWRIMFLLFGGFLFLFGILFILLYRPTEQGGNWKRGEQRPASVSIPIGDFLRDPLFVLLSAAIFLYVAAESSVIIWIAPYFEKFLGFSAADSAWRIGVYWGGLLIGRLLVSFSPPRYSMWQPFLLGGAGMLVGTFILAFHLSAVWTTALVAVVGLFSGPVWPCIVSISNHTRDNTQFTSGVLGIGALGVALGPFLSSLIIRFLGIGLLFYGICFMSLLLVIISVLIRLEAARESKRSGDRSP